MRHRLLNVGFGVMVMATVVIASGNREPLMPQQSTPDVKNEGALASRKDSIGKTVKDLSEQINDLKSRIRLLEAQQEELRGRLTRVERLSSG